MEAHDHWWCGVRWVVSEVLGVGVVCVMCFFYKTARNGNYYSTQHFQYWYQVLVPGLVLVPGM